MEPWYHETAMMHRVTRTWDYENTMIEFDHGDTNIMKTSTWRQEHWEMIIGAWTQRHEHRQRFWFRGVCMILQHAIISDPPSFLGAADAGLWALGAGLGALQTRDPAKYNIVECISMPIMIQHTLLWTMWYTTSHYDVPSTSKRIIMHSVVSQYIILVMTNYHKT